MRIADVLRQKWRAFSYYRGDRPLPGLMLRWILWGIHCLLRQPAVIEIPQYQMRLYLPPRWKGCWKALYVFGQRFFDVADPELAVVQEALRSGDVFVDAGAYHGWYALMASRVVGDSGCVLAFEPNPDAYALLTRNIALNDAMNVRAFNIALFSTAGPVWLYRGSGDGLDSALADVPGSMRREQVMANRLDDVLAEAHVERVNVMKLDVQGSEVDLLRGATQVLRRSRPMLAFEVYPDAAHGLGVSYHHAWDLLKDLGYTCFQLIDGLLAPLPELPIVPAGTFLNIIALPRGHGRLAERLFSSGNVRP
jgi:FkbM family methyltransferase